MIQDRYTYLIYKEWQNNLSDLERSELYKWLDASIGHQQQKDQLLMALKSMSTKIPSFEVDVEGDYNKVLATLGLVDGKPLPAKARSRPMIWLLIFCFLLGLFSAYYISRTDTIQSQELYASNAVDAIKEIELSDGSVVKLNVGSILKYPLSFDGLDRVVELSGEAYFEIERDETRPFVITTSQSKVEVLGTSFTIRESQNESITSVSVFTGKVRFTNIDNNTSIVLTKDQKGSIDSHGVLSKEDNENLNALAWESNRLRFKSTPVGQVFSDMANFYDVSILNKSTAIDNCTYSMSSQSISLDDLLENLKTVFHLEVERKGNNVIIVSGGDCNN